MIKINDMVELFHLLESSRVSDEWNLLFNLFIFSSNARATSSPHVHGLSTIPNSRFHFDWNWLIFDVTRKASTHAPSQSHTCHPQFFSVHFIYPSSRSPPPTVWLLIFYVYHLESPNSATEFEQFFSRPALWHRFPSHTARINKWIQLFIWKTSRCWFLFVCHFSNQQQNNSTRRRGGKKRLSSCLYNHPEKYNKKIFLWLRLTRCSFWEEEKHWMDVKKTVGFLISMLGIGIKLARLEAWAK